MLETFRPITKQLETRHLNGIPSDNQLENLAWGTRAENVQDSKIHGTFSAPPRNPHVRGSINGQSKLIEDDVRKIRKLLKSGHLLHREIAERFNICDRTISDIKRGISWSWLE